MGSSNIFRQIANINPIGYLVQKPRRDRKKLKASMAKMQAESRAEIERKQIIANESVKAQKEKERKRKIFAGSGTNNIFSPSLMGQSTLGASTGNKTLG